MIFSDLGTINVEATRGFSAYRWIRQQLIARGVPAGEIAFMQDFKRSADKQRLFADFRAGRVRVLIGSSDTMGTGVNVQQRLKALHHLDVPWLPSQIEQREGRIERQGNQHDEIDIYAYATLGSMDATMWQNNERKARFIEAALSGDRAIRRLEDAGSQANQFAMAKAIASGDSRLMQKAGLESEIARLQRQRAAHVDDQHAIRRQIRDAHARPAHAERRIKGDHRRPRPARADPRRRVQHGDRGPDDHAAQGRRRLAADENPPRRAGTRTPALDGRPHRRLRPDLRRSGLAGMTRGWSRSSRWNGPTTRSRSTSTPRRRRPGLLARLEHVIDRMETELEEQRRRVTDAKARLAGYEPRLGEAFPLQGELDAKLAQLAAIEADLAATEGTGGEADPAQPKQAA